MKILEYSRITEALMQHADSEPGRHMCEGLRPSSKKEWIIKNLDETEAGTERILKNGSISFGSNRDFSYALKSLSIGQSLSVTELLHIASFLENTARIKAYSGDTEDVLTVFFEELTPLPAIANEIRRVILSEDEISDQASPTLASIRRQIKLTGDKIHTQLNSMINGSARAYLQDPVITMRGDRYCIPVKSEYKSQVPGMVHDQSSTGSTFFIEPAAVVELNNKLKTLEIDEKNEIDRIIAELSASVSDHAEDISVNCKHMTRLDFVFAKADLALEMGATRPVYNDDRVIKIIKGRHPLIEKDRVVPIDITLGDEFDMLIVTGPNTGGKTVSLKTAGLLTLMGQAGLFIPASDRSELSVFKEVYADIGDEQSIEQSLSTFSSHMTNIVDILKKADENSLCLFDELGAGTDPTEGAALATAILDSLHRRGIRTMATTHYSELKVYALTTNRVENACCEFDVEKLCPTYRLLIGIPGRSNAFAISKRLGLSEEIIDAARLRMSEDQEHFEELMADLDKRRLNMEQRELELAEDEERFKADKEQFDASRAKLDTSRDKVLLEAREEAKRILQEAKDEADRTIRLFRNAGPGASMSDLERARSEIREKIKEGDASISDMKGVRSKKEPKPDINPDKLKPGDSVRIISSGLKGIISSLPDKSGKIWVQCGIIKSQVRTDDIVLTDEDDISAPGYTSSASKRKNTSGGTRISKTQNISTEINLLGMTVDEAIYNLDKYLDDAYLAHLPSVRIVHGKGTGALRNAVAAHLKKTKYVSGFRLGEYGEGDAGVTIAEFK